MIIIKMMKEIREKLLPIGHILMIIIDIILIINKKIKVMKMMMIKEIK